MTDPKKEMERWRLERFKNLIRDFPSGDIQPTEEPDFLVHAADRIVGVELTDLHRGTPPGQIPEQASEAMRKRVIARAQELYTAQKQPPVIVSFFLDDRVHIKKQEVEGFATELASIVGKNLPAPNSTVEVPTDWDDARELPSILHSLSIHRRDVLTDTFFNAPGATWLPTLNREDIERALASKDPKYDNYRAKCNEAWLVINADIETMATWFEFDPGVLSSSFKTRFDRVFLVEHFGGRAHELAITSSPAPLTT